MLVVINNTIRHSTCGRINTHTQVNVRPSANTGAHSHIRACYALTSSGKPATAHSKAHTYTQSSVCCPSQTLCRVHSLCSEYNIVLHYFVFLLEAKYESGRDGSIKRDCLKSKISLEVKVSTKPTHELHHSRRNSNQQTLKSKCSFKCNMSPLWCDESF